MLEEGEESGAELVSYSVLDPLSVGCQRPKANQSVKKDSLLSLSAIYPAYPSGAGTDLSEGQQTRSGSAAWNP